MEELQNYAIELSLEAEGLASLLYFVSEAASNINVNECGEQYRKLFLRTLNSLDYIAILAEQHSGKFTQLVTMTYDMEKVVKMGVVG